MYKQIDSKESWVKLKVAVREEVFISRRFIQIRRTMQNYVPEYIIIQGKHM